MSGYDASAVLLTKYVHVFVGAVGVTMPASIPDVTLSSSYTPPTGLTLLGHTSQQNGVTITPNGGDVSFVGSNQSPSLKTFAAPVTWQVAIPALQMTNDVCQAYFGGGDVDDDGVFGVPKSPQNETKALYVVLVDSDGSKAAFGVPKAILSGSGAITFTAGNIAELDIVAAVVDDDASDDLFQIYKAGLGTASS